jgi:DNA-binding NarL/FixJ family response regulator
MKEIRILLADDQERVRYGLRVLLRQQPRWNVIGEAENAQDLLALTEVLKPDLLLVDWDLPGMEIEALLSSLRTNRESLPVVVISGRLDVEDDAADAGATAFYNKTDPADQLIESIHSALKIKTS